MLPALSNRVPVAELAAHLLDKLREGYLLNESRISVHASVGVALYPEDGEDVNTLIDNADAACLRAKAMGKNGFQFYHPDMNLRSARRRRIEHHLKESLEQARRAANDGHPDSSGLYLEYQPQLCRNGISLLGIEALVRWKHTELGQVSPGEFVPVAEESGLVLALGDWVMQHALRDFSRLGLSPDGPVSLSVNLSRRQFLEPRLVERVTELLRAYGVQPQRLVLEITETEMLADVQKAATVVRQLHRLGIGIAIDDFGAGHSSFEALTHFPIDELKIDQSFVRELHRNPRDRDIVRAMIQVAHAIDATVVAEGVENGEQLYVLGDMRCDRLQGYYLAEPMSFDDLLHFADSRLRISVGGPLVS
jgi:EAL domain-containing protein (putative c-di-GMP-specific phosphodiesterase class I)